MISRIKILAKLDIAERRLPQDGRARLTLLGRRIDLRVATAPSMHGESMVIRILDQSAAGADFTSLGLDPDVERRLKRQIEAPYGMLLVTGPTGSGKTTTLYAALRHLNTVSDKLISIEDPVEYQIDGVTQIQVRPDIDLISPACCARSSGTTRTSSWSARPATPRPPTSRSTRR